MNLPLWGSLAPVITLTIGYQQLPELSVLTPRCILNSSLCSSLQCFPKARLSQASTASWPREADTHGWKHKPQSSTTVVQRSPSVLSASTSSSGMVILYQGALNYHLSTPKSPTGRKGVVLALIESVYPFGWESLSLTGSFSTDIFSVSWLNALWVWHKCFMVIWSALVIN